MKNRIGIVMLVLCTGVGHAQRHHLPTGEEMNRIGLYSGPQTQPKIQRPPPSPPIPDDWRELNGTIYNVAVKRRASESWTGSRYAPNPRVGANGELLPGWDRIDGLIRNIDGNTLAIEASTIDNEIVNRRKIQIQNYPKPELLKIHSPLVIYAYRVDTRLYDYGRPIPASEALKQIREARSATNAPVSAAAKTPGPEKRADAPEGSPQKSGSN